MCLPLIAGGRSVFDGANCEMGSSWLNSVDWVVGVVFDASMDGAEFWVLDLPVPLVVDVSLMGSSWSTSVEGRAVVLRWPTIGEDGAVGAPTRDAEAVSGVAWGESVSATRIVVEFVVIEICSVDSLRSREGFLRQLSEFRARWLSWLGVVTGQATTVRWVAPSTLRDRQGIFFVHSPAESDPVLIPSEMRTLEPRHPGSSVDAVTLSRELHAIVWPRVDAGEEPAFALWMFHSARETFQYRQHWSAVLELATALEALLWDEFSKLVMTSRKQMSLGRLAGNLARFGVVDDGEGSPMRCFVDLRNDLAHRADETFTRGECVDAFATGLGQFRRRYPDLFPVVSEEQLL